MDDPRDLLDRYDAGETTDADLAVLEKALRADAGLRRDFVHRALLDVQLRKILAEPLSVPESRTTRRASRRLARPAESRAGVWIAAAVAAGVMIALLIFASAPARPAPKDQVRLPDAPPAPSNTTPAPPPPAPKTAVIPPENRRKETDEEFARIAAERLKAESKPREEEKPPVPPVPPAPAPTEVAIAAFERDGAAAQPVKAGQAVEGDAGRLVFPDGTRLDLGAGTRIAEVTESAGKRLVLSRGAVSAAVAKQPAGKPLVIVTPHAEASVLGTTFRLSVANDPKKGFTRLDVAEGRVKIARLTDGRAVEVTAGQCAAAGPDLPLVARNSGADDPVVLGFSLVNADSGTVVPGFETIAEGAVLRLSSLPTRNLNIRVETLPRRVAAIRIEFDGRPTPAESAPPYTVFGDDGFGKYSAWKKPSPGPHAVSAQVHASATGPPVSSLTLKFELVDR